MIIAVILLVSGIAVSLGFADAEASNNYIDSVSMVIMESNYNQEVIDACKTEASENGYELIVVVEGDDKPGHKRYAQVTLKYDFKLGFFKISREKTRTKIV